PQLRAAVSIPRPTSESNMSSSIDYQSVPQGSDNGAATNNHPLNSDQQTNLQNWSSYRGNPLAHTDTGESVRYPPFAGYLQPGAYRPPPREFANPAPLGLAGFAATTFVLSLLNWHTRGLAEPNIVVSLAFGYGGLVQLLAGMWEMAAGNTFGATALSSYGGFWISLAIVLTPGGFEIMAAYDAVGFSHAFSFFLFGWFIFTTLMVLCVLRSTVVFFLLFFFVWLTFLCLALAYLYCDATGTPNIALQKSGGMFGILAAFLAWYVALAGIADDSNSFFTIPVWHFPWSEKGRAARQKTEELKA
ncbi:Acetate permease A, partial [Lachnellula suecica]